MINLTKNLTCLRDRFMVKVAQHMLAKIDRLFNLYWWGVLVFGVVGAAFFCFGFMGAASYFGYGSQIWFIVSVSAPLSVAAWMLTVSPWLQGSENIAAQRPELNQVVAEYGVMPRNHYTRAEAWLVSTYLAPAQRIEQAARQLEYATSSATSQATARRL
jgi:hypothetical protein